MFTKYSLPVKKNTKFCCLHFTKFRFLEKLSPLVHRGYSFSIAWISAIIHQNIQKDSSKNKVNKETPTILTMFHPLLTLLNITNVSLCHRSFFLNTCSLD